jgi:NAD(P)H-dependent flavin oxidoreductase YrpB (nitropropane dioxygenase family)
MADLVGVQFPLFAFSHCRDVVVTVSKAGGFGVLGASGFTPEELENELGWIDAHIGGCPYGVDILMPDEKSIRNPTDLHAFNRSISRQHVNFAVELLERHGVGIEAGDMAANRLPNTTLEFRRALMDVALRHPVRLIVSALGVAPRAVIDRCHSQGVHVGALVGAKEHAVAQVAAGIDILIAQGTEAGGHCGEVSTLVLLPEVLRATSKIRTVPVLAAGGIVSGSQMAACMVMGAAGAWTGTIWLATPESGIGATLQDKFIRAQSRDTVRSRARTGKPSRQLRSCWHEAWEGAASPGVLPMPQMSAISRPAFRNIERSAESGNERAKDLLSYFVGQGVGLVESVRPASRVVQDFKEEFADAMNRFVGLSEIM